MKKLALVAALPDEAACLYGRKLIPQSPVEIAEGIYLCLSGIGSAAANEAIKSLVHLNVDALISWGVAGGLEPSLNSGDLIIANSVVTNDRIYHTTAAWQKKIIHFCAENEQHVLTGPLFSTDKICASTSEKHHLFSNSKAIAIDMESSAIAKQASCYQLDFILIRSIADEAKMSVPDAVLKHTDDFGRPKLFKFIGSCLSKPNQIKEVYKLASSYQAALATLRRIAPMLKKQQFLYD